MLVKSCQQNYVDKKDWKNKQHCIFRITLIIYPEFGNSLCFVLIKQAHRLTVSAVPTINCNPFTAELIS